MPYCHECGSEVGDEWEFCRKCGSDLPPLSESDQNRTRPPQEKYEALQENLREDQSQTTSTQSSSGLGQLHSQNQSSSGQETKPAQTRQTQSDGSRRESAENQFTPGRVLVIMGGVAVGVAAFLPWITASFAGQSVSIAGMEELGQITLAGGGLVVLLSLLDWSAPTQSVAVLLGLIVGLTGGLYVLDPLASTDMSSFPEIGRKVAREVVKPGVGAYLTALGGLSVLSGSTYDLID